MNLSRLLPTDMPSNPGCKGGKSSTSGRSTPTQRTQRSLRRLQDVLKRSRRLMTNQDVTMSRKRRRI